MINLILSSIDIIMYIINIIISIIIFVIMLNLIKKYDVANVIKIRNTTFPKSLKGCYIDKYNDYFEIHNDKNFYYTVYNKDLKEFLKENNCFKKIKINHK